MERAVSLAKRRNLVFGWRNMARKKEVRVVLLAALIVTLGVGPVAARIVVTDDLAFVASTVRTRTPSSSSSPSTFKFQRDVRKTTAVAPRRYEQHQTTRLRPRCGWGLDCPSLSPDSVPDAFSAPLRRRRRRPRQQQHHLVVAASSGLQEPLERVASIPAQNSAAGRSDRVSYGRGGAVVEAAEGVDAADGGGYDRKAAGSVYGGEAEVLRGAVLWKEEENDADKDDEDGDGEDDDFEGDDIDIYLPGGMGAGLRPGAKPRRKRPKPPVMWSKPVRGRKRLAVVLAGREDLDEAGALCIKVFFGQPDSPWKAAQLRQLLHEQRQDLESRCSRRESVMFKAIDTRRKDAMVGFVEVSETSGSKYGMGSGIPLADTRPVVSNLAVDPRVRRCGVGSALMEACEDLVKTWNFDEIILQVEEDNEAALAFYRGKSFKKLFVDKAARRYDTSGFLLQNVRTSKLTMRKALGSSTKRSNSGDSLANHVSHLFGFLSKPFVVRPPPSKRLPARSTASVETLFGRPGAGGSGSGVRRPRSVGSGRRVTSSGGRVGSSSSSGGISGRSSGGSEAAASGHETSPSSSSSSSSGEISTSRTRLPRTIRRR